jgi:hypothetical protein
MCCIQAGCVWSIWPCRRLVCFLLCPLRLWPWPRCDWACTIIESFWRRSERRRILQRRQRRRLVAESSVCTRVLFRPSAQHSLLQDGVSERLEEVRGSSSSSSRTTCPNRPPLCPSELLARSLSGCQPPFAMLLNLSAISACWVQVYQLGRVDEDRARCPMTSAKHKLVGRPFRRRQPHPKGAEQTWIMF